MNYCEYVRKVVYLPKIIAKLLRLLVTIFCYKSLDFKHLHCTTVTWIGVHLFVISNLSTQMSSTELKIVLVYLIKLG